MEGLVRRYYNRVFSYCVAILMNRETAEDATQDVFFKIQDRILKGDPVPNRLSWILTVARNRCYDILRKERRLVISEAPLDELPGKTGTPETILMGSEALDLVQTCLLELSLEERQLIVLRDLNELSYSAVAEHLETSVKKVKWKLYKARKRLGKLIGERYV